MPVKRLPEKDLAYEFTTYKLLLTLVDLPRAGSLHLHTDQHVIKAPFGEVRQVVPQGQTIAGEVGVAVESDLAGVGVLNSGSLIEFDHL